jgi:hypothetical protein
MDSIARPINTPPANPHQWQVGRVRDADRIVRWLPVTNLSEAPHSPSGRLGITDEGTWVVSGHEGLVVDAAWSHYWVLLPLLEHPFEDAARSVAAGLEAAGVQPGAEQAFPWEKVIECALEGPLDYWARLALDWIPAVGLTPALAQALRSLEQARWASQQVRHRARSLLRRHGEHIHQNHR